MQTFLGMVIFSILGGNDMKHLTIGIEFLFIMVFFIGCTVFNPFSDGNRITNQLQISK